MPKTIITILLCLAIIGLTIGLWAMNCYCRRLEGMIALNGSGMALMLAQLDKDLTSKAKEECKLDIRETLLFAEKESAKSDEMALFILEAHKYLDEINLSQEEKKRISRYIHWLERKKGKP